MLDEITDIMYVTTAITIPLENIILNIVLEISYVFRFVL